MSAAIADDVPALAVAAAETAERTERRRARGGCAVYAAIALLIPSLIVGGICFWIHFQDRSLAEEAKKKARAAGDPLSAEEFQAAFYPASPEIEEATRRWLVACDAMEQASVSPAAKDLPDTGRFVPAPPERQPALDERGLYADSTLTTLDRFFEAGGDEAVAAVHAARRAAAPPRAACDLLEAPEPALPYVGVLFVSGTLLALEAERKAARGDVAAVTEALLSVIAMSDACAAELSPHGIGRRSQAHRWACLSVRGMIERIDFSDAQLAQFDEALAQADFRADLIRHLQAEQYRIVRALETDEPVQDQELAFFRDFPLRGADEAMAIENCQELLDGARIDLESAQAACDRVTARMTPMEGTVDQIRYQIALLRAREADPRVCLVLQAEADRRLTRTLLACERYRLKHDSWPASLEALVPEFLSEVPQDVLGGESVTYLLRGKRLKLGSTVSENLSRAYPPPVDMGRVEVAFEKPREASPEPAAP
ncbi:MAG TPA: hypothetical protein VGN57_03160 [Pirellulaceae bacterium]|jgi:hypothetical protein|nr:hypothetical protein [Pirellulaceae bacterium]